MAGEVMASRWAFEALAVNQYKNNAYQKPLYKLEKTKSVADYLKNLWLPILRAKLDACINNYPYQYPLQKKEFEYNLKLLKSEIEFRNKKSAVKFNEVESITEANFNAELIKKLKNYFDEFGGFQMRKYNNAVKEEEAIINKLTFTDSQREAYAKLKEQSDNENLNQLVRNSNDFTKVIESEGKIIQRVDPIYNDPDRERFLRSHFFAPRKVIFGRYFDTYWVNICVIWIMSIILIFTLYFNTLKKLLDSFEAISDRIKHLRKKGAEKIKKTAKVEAVS
jgi:hypothetical protein